MIVFPAVDIQAGKAVRLRRGDFDDFTVFSDDPVELARYWQDEGAEALHVIDLDAARTGDLTNFAIVERIVKALDIPVQYGGGIRTPKALAMMAGIRRAVGRDGDRRSHRPRAPRRCRELDGRAPHRRGSTAPTGWWPRTAGRSAPR